MKLLHRLILSFVLVVLIAIASMFFVTRQAAVGEVRLFMARGGMVGLDRLVTDLETYYNQSGSWQGAAGVLDTFRMGMGAGYMGGAGQGRGQAGGPGGMMGGVQHLQLADAHGNIVADNQSAPVGQFSSTEFQNAISLADNRGRVVGYLLAEGAVIENPYAETLLLNRLVRASLISAAVGGGLALLLALLLSYRLQRPVHDLTQAAARMAAGDLRQQVKVQGRDELANLGQAFNHMAASLQLAEQNRRAMTADIAHELRTPIAVQRALLEALQDGIYPLTVENLQPVLQGTELLTRLVEDLRTLALAEAGELRLERSPKSLPALVLQVMDRFRPDAENHQVQFVIEDHSQNRADKVMIDPGRVEQILHNLLQQCFALYPRRRSSAARIERRRFHRPFASY